MSNKFMRIIALLLVLTCMLVSCEKIEEIFNNKTLEYYEENLNIEYKTFTMDQERLEYYDETWRVDFCQHGALNGLIATHKHNENQILILECESKTDAENLANYVMQTNPYSYLEFKDFDVRQDEQFVLLGDRTAILEALGN